jgi:hypothetical protein
VLLIFLVFCVLFLSNVNEANKVNKTWGGTHGQLQGTEWYLKTTGHE